MMNAKEKKEFEEWKREVKRDYLNHGTMSKDTKDAMKELEINFNNMDDKLDNLNEHWIRADEKLKMILEKLNGFDKKIEHLDKKYATKTDLKLLEAKINPTKQIVMGAVAAILMAFVGTIIGTVIT